MQHIRNNSALHALYLQNDVETQQKLIEELTKKPVKDCVGYAYMFDRTSDKKLKRNFHVKIGRTADVPTKRVLAQSGEMLDAVRTKHNVKLENVIKCFFKFANEHRISPIDGHCETEWYYFVNSYTISEIGILVRTIANLVETVFGGEYDDEEETVEDDVEEIVHESKDEDENKGKFNINTCTVQQLMTIRDLGGSGTRAQNIIDYREKYGQFNKLEDVMLVSQIGNARYGYIKEKCYCKPITFTEDVVANEITHIQRATDSPVNKVGKININTCSREDLMTISGLGGKGIYAQNIIDYRNKHGKFTELKDVMLVKGVKTSVFGNMETRCYCE
jgi:competence ComEA-like helix-hairpin-helix protein